MPRAAEDIHGIELAESLHQRYLTSRNMTAFSKESDFVRTTAQRAGEIALSYFARGIAYESKEDLSPVTIADRECEQAIARAIEETFPDDGILGEEGSCKET